ncbi:MAG: NADH-quinone oxidoreductase subunit I [Thermaerobacterales bacterium]
MAIVHEVLRTARSVAKGMGITFRSMFQPEVTVHYPDELPDLPTGSRGIPVLKVNEETGELNCTACGLCARSCPPSCIEIVEETDADGKRQRRPLVFNIDMGKCMVCNLCIEACPFDALEMAVHFEMSGYTPQDLVFDKDQLADVWKNYDAVRIAGGEQV